RKDAVRRALAPAARALVSDDDAPLLSALKARRRALAEAAAVPAYVIFPDRTLAEMARLRPATLDEMARISGVGAKKLESYGADFLSVFTGEAAGRVHPARRRLAGQTGGDVFDLLAAAQRRLERGETGVDKPLSCTAATLARIAAARPRSLDALGRHLDPPRLDRFGQAFLAAVEAAIDA